MFEDEMEERCQTIIDGLNWTGPIYKVSAVSGAGTKPLVHDIMKHIETIKEQEQAEISAQATNKTAGSSATASNQAD